MRLLTCHDTPGCWIDVPFPDELHLCFVESNPLSMAGLLLSQRQHSASAVVSFEAGTRCMCVASSRKTVGQLRAGRSNLAGQLVLPSTYSEALQCRQLFRLVKWLPPPSWCGRRTVPTAFASYM